LGNSLCHRQAWCVDDLSLKWCSSGLSENRLNGILVLFILFLVTAILLSEGGDIDLLELFGRKITPMNKATFYFIIFILVIIDIVQGKYQKKLLIIEKAAANISS
jgi:hypothetical protein